jgi:GNAT superfamily N-acetyltransferase
MTISFRTMTAGDVPLGMMLKDQAGWNQVEADWLRFLAMEPEGCVVAEWEGRPVGTTATTVLGDVGWIAMVLVEKAVRGRGIGTRLVEHAIAHLERRKVGTMRLDATGLGRPVYEKLGFVPEYEVARWEGIAAAAAPGPRVSPIAADELDAVVELDRDVTGTDRRRLIEHLYRRQPDAMRGVRVRGKVAAYATHRRGSRAVQIGPVVALEPAVGVALFDEALHCCAGQPVFVDIPAENSPATNSARFKGLVFQRKWMRMRRGRSICDRPAQLWASSGPENG